MTRAEDRLYVCGWETNLKAEKMALTWHGLVEAGIRSLEDHVEEDVYFSEAPMLVLDDQGDVTSVDAVQAATVRSPTPRTRNQGAV